MSISDYYSPPQRARLGRESITVNDVTIPGVLARHIKLRYRANAAYYPLAMTVTLYLDEASIDAAVKPWVSITQELTDPPTAKDAP